MPATVFPTRRFDAFLFDMDGTILTSIEAAERVWAAWAHRHGLDVAAFLPTIHGVRTVDTVRRLDLPGIDAEAEAAAITRAEMQDVAGIDPIAGAGGFLAALPADRWAVVTSAPRLLADRRIAAAGLPAPRLMIAGEDVEHGKPAPDGYRLAASRLGFAAEDCLAFEDAPAGIAAAEAAGATLVVITAIHAHPPAAPRPKAPHFSVPDYRALAVTVQDCGLLLRRHGSEK